MGHEHVHFEEAHACWQTELYGKPSGIADTPAVKQALREQDFAALGEAYRAQMRYREAAIAYSLDLDDMGERLSILRQRAGKYLTTMQLQNARQDFLRCAELGADELDVGYRLGLCEYYAGNYRKAMAYFEDVLPTADDEMGVAIIYWHTLAAWRAQAEPVLLEQYRAGMQIGHHTGYDRALRLITGAEKLTDYLLYLCGETVELEFSIVAYGAARYLLHRGEEQQGEALLKAIRNRDGFWISFAFLAAVNDLNGGTGRFYA